MQYLSLFYITHYIFYILHFLFSIVNIVSNIMPREPRIPKSATPKPPTGNGTPAKTPANGTPAKTPGNGTPAKTPGNGSPAKTPANGTPAKTQKAKKGKQGKQGKPKNKGNPMDAIISKAIDVVSKTDAGKNILESFKKLNSPSANHIVLTFESIKQIVKQINSSGAIANAIKNPDNIEHLKVALSNPDALIQKIQTIGAKKAGNKTRKNLVGQQKQVSTEIQTHSDRLTGLQTLSTHKNANFITKEQTVAKTSLNAAQAKHNNISKAITLHNASSKKQSKSKPKPNILNHLNDGGLGKLFNNAPHPLKAANGTVPNKQDMNWGSHQFKWNSGNAPKVANGTATPPKAATATANGTAIPPKAATANAIGTATPPKAANAIGTAIPPKAANAIGTATSKRAPPSSINTHLAELFAEHSSGLQRPQEEFQTINAVPTKKEKKLTNKLRREQKRLAAKAKRQEKRLKRQSKRSMFNRLLGTKPANTSKLTAKLEATQQKLGLTQSQFNSMRQPNSQAGGHKYSKKNKYKI